MIFSQMHYYINSKTLSIFNGFISLTLYQKADYILVIIQRTTSKSMWTGDCQETYNSSPSLQLTTLFDFDYNYQLNQAN